VRSDIMSQEEEKEACRNRKWILWGLPYFSHNFCL